MKTLISSILVLLLTTATTFADDASEHTPYTGSADFERLKGLAGTWQGTSVMLGMEQQVRVEYRITSAGSAVVETLFPGTAHEMLSIYHDQNGKPGMTHYCALKNQPKLVMDNSTGDSIHFNFTESAGVDAGKDAHMHELTIHFIEKDRIEQEWVLYGQGEPVDTTRLVLQRM